MAPQVEELGDNKVRLTVDVPSHDMHHAVEHATGDLASSVRIPGFRKGKVPKQVLLSRLGRERVYQEAIESHIGGWFWNAAATTRVRPVELPQYDYELPSSESEPWSFRATFAVQALPTLPDWRSLEVPKPDAEVPSELVDAELQTLQTIAAELAPVEGRPAQLGDVVVLDVVDEEGRGQRSTIVDLGGGRLVEEIERGVLGLGAGESKTITYEVADSRTRTVTATVTEIREKVLPPLDDELAKSTSEFETLAELRADIEERLREELQHEIDLRFRADAADTLVDATEVNAAGPLVESRTRELLQGLARSLEARGIDAATYMSVTGQTPELLEERLRAEATQSVARELVLEALANDLAIEIGDDEIRDLVREQAEAAGEDADALMQQIFESGRHEQLRDDMRLGRALDTLVAEVKPIPVELAEARDAIWTPDKEKQPTETKLWTPGSKENV
jgi:trigger factor